MKKGEKAPDGSAGPCSTFSRSGRLREGLRNISWAGPRLGLLELSQGAWDALGKGEGVQCAGAGCPSGGTSGKEPFLGRRGGTEPSPASWMCPVCFPTALPAPVSPEHARKQLITLIRVLSWSSLCRKGCCWRIFSFRALCLQAGPLPAQPQALQHRGWEAAALLVPAPGTARCQS